MDKASTFNRILAAAIDRNEQGRDPKSKQKLASKHEASTRFVDLFKRVAINRREAAKKDV